MELAHYWKLVIGLLPILAFPSPAQDLDPDSFLNFKDPRQKSTFSEWIKDGKETNSSRSISHAILVICWAPNPEGKFATYEISGIDGFHKRTTVESFLNAFYSLESSKSADTKHNIIVAGNNWGSGRELSEPLTRLSKENSFSVYYIGGWGFQKAILDPEPPQRLSMIRNAFQKAIDRGDQQPKEPTEMIAKDLPAPNIVDGIWTIPLRYWAHVSPTMDGGMNGYSFLCEVSKLGPHVANEDDPSKFRSGELKVLETLRANSRQFPILKTLTNLKVEGCANLKIGDRIIVFVDGEPYESGYVVNYHQGTNCLIGHRLLRKSEYAEDLLGAKRKQEAKLLDLIRAGKTDMAKASSDELEIFSVMDPDGVRLALIRERHIRELSENEKKTGD